MSTTDNPCLPYTCEEMAASQLLGPVWNWCLYGALVVQFYVYSYNFSRDDRYIKIMVYMVFFLETAQTALSGADLYLWFVTGFGNLEYLTGSAFQFFDVPILGSVVSLIVQFFFAYRILVLSEKRSWWLCIIICLLSVVSAFGAFALGMWLYLGHDSHEFRGLLNPKTTIMIWIIANMLSDMLIASAMLYHLRKIRARDGKLSSHVFVSIVRVTVETNLVTTTVNVVTVVSLCLKSYYWLSCPAYIFGKLYSNTLLVSLNNRIAIRDIYEARGPVVDFQAMMPFKSSARPRSSTNTIILEPEKPQECRMNKLVVEADVADGVNIAMTIDVV